jgi:hypothetical protein
MWAKIEQFLLWFSLILCMIVICFPRECELVLQRSIDFLLYLHRSL